MDSKEVAFVAAGKKALLDAIGHGKPIVLEPVVEIRITAPNANAGDLSGDLQARRGHVTGTRSLSGGRVCLSGQVPLAEMQNYSSRLKSITAGEGSYEIEFHHYAPVPDNLQQTLMKSFKPVED